MIFVNEVFVLIYDRPRLEYAVFSSLNHSVFNYQLSEVYVCQHSRQCANTVFYALANVRRKVGGHMNFATAVK